MSNKISVYITFPKTGTGDLWIQKFIDNLKFSAGKILGERFEFRIKNIHFESVNSVDSFSANDLFIIIFPSKPDENTDFQSELNSIAKIVGLDENSRMGSSRIFKILLSPNDSIPQPDFIKMLIGYNFFDSAGKRKAILPLDFEHNNQKTWARILDLVYDIKEVFFDTSENEKSSSKHCVYLGSCSEDQWNTRDDIRRELQHFGFRILPAINLPLEKARIEEVVLENLKKSKFIIQVLGEQYGPMSAEGRNSVFEIESLAIKNYLSENNDITGFIWIPAELKVSDSKQELFINRIKRDDSLKQSQIIESAPAEFKEIIARFVETGKRKVGAKDLVDLYIISQQDNNTASLESMASRKNIIFRKDKENGRVISYQQHLDILENTNNVLIQYDNADFDWLKSKTGDAVKALGMGREEPFRQIVIQSKESIDLSEFTPLLPSLENIAENDSNSLENFFNNIVVKSNER
jgi:hypothetical protein